MTINLITCRKILLKGVAKCQIPNFNFFRYFASNFIIFFVSIALFFFYIDTVSSMVIHNIYLPWYNYKTSFQKHGKFGPIKVA
jgi:hypothetical protein